jgi:hypothetical protein
MAEDLQREPLPAPVEDSVPANTDQEVLSRSDRGEASAIGREGEVAGEDAEGTESAKQETSEEEVPSAEAAEPNGDEEREMDETIEGPLLVDTRVVRLKMDELNPHLVCRICSGYFRDAYTITECLHTFCKSCLLLAFDNGGRTCPHCKVDLGPHPLNMILYDRTMQELVNKILPDLEAEDQVCSKCFVLVMYSVSCSSIHHLSRRV